MSFRKFTSLTAVFTFSLILFTSVVLYCTPQGRIAYWADWKLLGLTKDQWGAIHINIGAVFLIFMFLHIYYNWSLILNYFKSRTSAFFSKESILSCALVLFCFIGTLADLPPFSTIMTLNNDIKVQAANKYGEPPYGHAELSSIASFAKRLNLEGSVLVATLKKAGFAVANPKQTLKDIAAANNVSPQTIYLAFPPATASETQQKAANTLPPSPPPGTGNMTLAELGSQFAFNTESVVMKLELNGLQLSPSMTIKEIASANTMSPHDIYDVIRETVISAGNP